MRKLVVIVLSLISCTVMQALPIGNPTEAGLFTNGTLFHSFGCYDFCDPCFSLCDAWSVRLGFYGSYVYDRHMEVEGNGYPDIEKTELYTNAGYIALNFCNRYELFSSIGVTNLAFANNMNAFPRSDNSDEFMQVEFSPELSWSIGIRGTVWELGSFGLGIEGQYFRCAPSLNYIIAGESNHYTYVTGDRVHYDEWQIGAGLAYRFEVFCPEVSFIPYLGVSWSRAVLDMNELQVDLVGADPTITLLDMKSKNPWGYSVGISATFYEVVGVTVEGRFGGEKALFVKGQLRF